MVDFTLSEEEINLREIAHDLAEEEIRRLPGTTTGTGHGRRRSSTKGGK
jgi:hypothetical protein